MSAFSRPVVGRFAPSPTGPLHLGSLIAALGSFLEVRASGGTWLVRIEDLDPPREVPGAAAEILRTLDSFGLGWDGSVMYQSTRTDAYGSALETLFDAGHAYGCSCSRRDVASSARRGPCGLVYPGTCRDKANTSTTQCVRVRATTDTVGFIDASQGPQAQVLERDVGDFVVRRGDGLHAYQLAVVADDAAQGVNQIVRGCDLLTSTPRQIYLQTLFGWPTPTYRHLPLAVTADGLKLSKATSAPPVNRNRAGRELVCALEFLGQDPPSGLERGSARDVIDWAMVNWNADTIPAVTASRAVETATA